jgi:hypothetical protein
LLRLKPHRMLVHRLHCQSDVNSIVVINTIVKSFKSICRQVAGSDHEEPILCCQEKGRVFVKKKAEYINCCDSAQVKSKCFKYIKNCADLPIDQQSQINFLVRKFNSSAIIAAFSMLIGKVGGAAPMLFFPLPTMKKDLIQQFLCLIFDTKLMMINTKEECYRYVRSKYSYSEYFGVFC